MEVEKRKKRAIREHLEEDKREKLKKLKEKEAGGGGRDSGVAVPSEEEVEEFFAILRRMKVAVKYFDERGKHDGRQWREALEQAEITLDDGETTDDVAGDGEVDLSLMKKKDEEEVTINNDVLDLNTVAPEAAESGGA